MASLSRLSTGPPQKRSALLWREEEQGRADKKSSDPVRGRPVLSGADFAPTWLYAIKRLFKHFEINGVLWKPY